MTVKVWNQLKGRWPPVLKRVVWEERGANMVIFAFGLMVLMGFGGIAVDGGNVYYQQQRMQIAADAAALGGARALANGQTTIGVDAQIRNLAEANGADTVTWRYISDGKGVHVACENIFDAFFAKLYGHNTFDVLGESEAQYEPIAATDNLFPMTFSCNCINGGESTFIDPPDEDETIGGGCPLMPIALDESTLQGAAMGDHLEDIFNGTQPGNFGWLSWIDVTDAGSLEDSLTLPGTSDLYVNPHTGEAGLVVPGVDVSGLTGVDNSSGVRAAMDVLLTTDILVPVWDTTTDTGSNTYYHIIGFAKVRLTDYNLPSGRISARYLGMANGCDEFGTGTATVNMGDGTSSRYDISFIEKTGDTWTYRVQKLWGEDLDWWGLELPACDGKFASMDAGAFDGNLLSWTLPAGFSDGEFTFVLNNDYVSGPVPVAVSASGATSTAELTGPDCNLTTDGVDTSDDDNSSTSLAVCLPPIDFQIDDSGGSLVRGQIIDNEWSAWGVHVTTNNPASHPAMVFDSAAPTGGDDDLGTPNTDFGGPGVGDGGGLNQPGQNDSALGNLMILSEDNDADDPDDNGGGGQLIMTFDVGVRMDDVYMVDVDSYEVAGKVRAYSDLGGSALLVENSALGLGGNSVQAVPVNATGVRRLEIDYPGSGGVPAIVSCRNEAIERYSIGDLVWDDADGDGLQDENEPGIAGVELELYMDGQNQLVAETETNSRGIYRFEYLPPGVYDVKIASSNFASGAVLDDAVLTTRDVGSDTLDSDFNSSTKKARTTLPHNGGNDLTVDAGMLLSSGGGTAAPDHVTVEVSDNKDSQYEIRLLSQVGRTYTYSVREVSGRNLNYWSLGIENCLDHIDGYSPADALIGPDSVSGFQGIKWETSSGFESGQFSFTLDDDYALSSASALVVSNVGGFADIAAPDCSILEDVDPGDGGGGDDGGSGGSDDDDGCNFRWLDWDGSSGTNLELADAMDDTRQSGSWSIGRVITPGPAVSSSSLVSAALNNRVGDEFVIPLTEWTGTGYEVCGFAQVRLLDYNLGSDPIQMSVQFLKGMARSGDTDPLADDYGARDVIIVD